jgi:hypothetical protein
MFDDFFAAKVWERGQDKRLLIKPEKVEAERGGEREKSERER